MKSAPSGNQPVGVHGSMPQRSNPPMMTSNWFCSDTFGAPINQNGGDATISGLELEAQFAISDVFRLSASAGWLDAEFDSVLPPTALPFQPVTEDSAFPNSPEFQGTLSPEFEFPVNNGTVRLRVDWIFSDDVHQTFENDPELFPDVLPISSMHRCRTRTRTLAGPSHWAATI